MGYRQIRDHGVSSSNSWPSRIHWAARRTSGTSDPKASLAGIAEREIRSVTT